METDAEVAIVGAGPIGIELAIALKKQAISYIQFDKGQVGQMIYNFPFQTQFFSSSERIAIANIPIQTSNQQKCTRERYLAYLRSCVLEHRLRIRTFEKVIAIQKNEKDKTFSIETDSARGRQTYKTHYLVLATGGTESSRMLNIPGEDLPHVSTKIEDPHLYFQKNITIIGSRNSAVEWALRCFHAGAHVTLISRREGFYQEHIKYWLLPEINSLVKERKIYCNFSSLVTQIFSDKIKLSTHGNISLIDADFVIKAIGFLSDASLFKQIGIQVSENDVPIFNHDTMETNIENAFVMGTATGGTQIGFKVFIENCHEHSDKIIETIGKQLKKEIKFIRKNTSPITPEQ